MKRILITGAAGFIGSHLSEFLLDLGCQVSGVDNFDPFYSQSLKEENLSKCLSNPNFTFHNIDILDKNALDQIKDVDIVLHLAAKAGVRPSIEDPNSYYRVNFMGTKNILDWMVDIGCKKLIFASSSSVYGNAEKVPFSEDQSTDHPISPYAASKKAAEILNYTYHAIHGISILNLRLFTVYGPRQRPDLAIRKFVDLILNGETVSIFGKGDTYRDYTFIDDVVNGFARGIEYLAKTKNAYMTFNIASGNPIGIKDLVDTIGSVLGKVPVTQNLPMQPGDVDKTYASIVRAKEELAFIPKFTIEEGLKEYINWKL